MERALKESGFDVIKAENATIREMRRLVRDFGDRLKASGGVGMFYFAGHGVQVYGENYLVSVDSDIRNEDEVADDSINAQLVLEKMQSAGNRMNLVVLDACRNNPFAVRMRSSANGLASMKAPSGSLVAYATAPGSVASDGSGTNGLYTQHLARAIAQPGLQVEEVFKQVRTAVRRDSKNQQTPWENTALEGQFYFKPATLPAPPLAAIPAPVPAPPVAQPARPSPPEPPSVELALWESVRASTVPSEVQLCVDRYPRGAFVDLAKARLIGLTNLAVTPVRPNVDLAERGAGRMTIRDEFTGSTTAIDVYPSARTSEATTYSSGDVIAAGGEVLAVRFGTYVGKVTSGRLWTLPLRDGASGSAAISFGHWQGAGQFTWRVVRKDGRDAQVEVDNAANNAGCERTGSWNVQYRIDAPLSAESRLVLSTGPGCVMGGAVRTLTEWKAKQ